MDTNIICQEILITTESRFFTNGFKDLQLTPSKKMTRKQFLAEACWNGLLKHTLPEILNDLELININEGERILDLRFGENGQQVDTKLSINPYLFLNYDRRN
ncbi:MAG: hypothetical protein ABIN48_00140 [Ginsengibacter sp.]